GQIPQGVEGAVARTVRRDLVRAQPAPVHMAEQVVLQADGRVDLLEREAGGYSGSGGHRRLLGVGVVRERGGSGDHGGQAEDGQGQGDQSDRQGGVGPGGGGAVGGGAAVEDQGGQPRGDRQHEGADRQHGRQ